MEVIVARGNSDLVCRFVGIIWKWGILPEIRIIKISVKNLAKVFSTIYILFLLRLGHFQQSPNSGPEAVMQAMMEQTEQAHEGNQRISRKRRFEEDDNDARVHLLKGLFYLKEI